MDNVLLYFALKYQGNWEQIYTALDKKEKIDHDDFVQLTSSINANFISIINPLYPSSLKNAHKPPFVLFAEGDLNLLTNYHQIICLSSDETFNDYGKFKDVEDAYIFFSSLSKILKKIKIFDKEILYKFEINFWLHNIY